MFSDWPISAWGKFARGIKRWESDEIHSPNERATYACGQPVAHGRYWDSSLRRLCRPAINPARPAAWALLSSPALGEGGHRSLACRLVAVGRAAYLAVVAARPHRGAIRRCNRHLEDAADDHAILQHVVVVLVPADRRALENELARRRCLGAAPRMATALSAKKTEPKTARSTPQATIAQNSARAASKTRSRVLASISAPRFIKRGSNQAAPPPCARVDGLEPIVMKRPRARRQAIFLGAIEPRAARPGRTPPRGGAVSRPRPVGGSTPPPQRNLALVTDARQFCARVRARSGDAVLGDREHDEELGLRLPQAAA